MAITSLTILSKNILKEQHILIGFQFYLETFHPKSGKLLLESSNKDIILENFFSKIVSSIKSIGDKNKFKDFVTATGIALSKIKEPEFKDLLQGAFKEITNQGLSREEVIKLFNIP